MGRANRPKSEISGASADGSRGRASAGLASAQAPGSLADKCKTEHQRSVYNIVNELYNGGVGVELDRIMNRAKESIDDPREVMIAIGGMTEGFGWEDKGSDRTHGPLLKLDESNLARPKILPLSKDYHESITTFQSLRHFAMER